MNDTCDICHARDSMLPHLEVGLPGVGAAWIHECGGCGFKQIRPPLEATDLAALYTGEYFDPATSVGFDEYARQQQRYEREAFFLAKQLRAMAPAGRVLDVGCALGFLLGALSRVTAWQVEGVEVSMFAVQYARERSGLVVRRGTLEEASFPAESFDFVIQKDLLEHVAHPRRHLEETWRVMRPGGRVWLITPNGEANLRPLRAVADTLGEDVLPLLDQGHLSFFSREQLMRLLAGSGFRCLRFRSIGIRRGLRALGYLPGKRCLSKTVARAALTRATGRVVRIRTPDVEEMVLLGDRIDTEIERRHQRVRSWVPYFYYRRWLKRLDSLPASLTVGHDFELLLEKV